MIIENIDILKPVLENAEKENHYISDKMREFIEKNIDLIEYSNWDELFRQTFEEEFTELNYIELRNILSKVLDISPDILAEQRFKVAEYWFLDRVDYEYTEAQKDIFERKNHHWDRFWYVMEAVALPDMEPNEFLQHLLKPEVQKRLNIKMKLLEPEYGWYGSGDYSILGLFNKKTFEIEE